MVSLGQKFRTNCLSGSVLSHEVALKILSSHLKAFLELKATFQHGPLTLLLGESLMLPGDA